MWGLSGERAKRTRFLRTPSTAVVQTSTGQPAGLLTRPYCQACRAWKRAQNTPSRLRLLLVSSRKEGWDMHSTRRRRQHGQRGAACLEEGAEDAKQAALDLGQAQD